MYVHFSTPSRPKILKKKQKNLPVNIFIWIHWKFNKKQRNKINLQTSLLLFFNYQTLWQKTYRFYVYNKHIVLIKYQIHYKKLSYFWVLYKDLLETADREICKYWHFFFNIFKDTFWINNLKATLHCGLHTIWLLLICLFTFYRNMHNLWYKLYDKRDIHVSVLHKIDGHIGRLLELWRGMNANFVQDLNFCKGETLYML
jgi:hypothetical protein